MQQPAGFYGPDLLPPFPTIDLLNPAIIPSPPKLSPDDPDGSWALSLVRAYRGAVASRFKVQSQTFRRGNLTTSRYFKPLVEAAKLLIEHDIAPASWAAFSCDVWKHYGKTVKPPSLQWTFAAKRVTDRAGWFKSEVSSYTGRRIVFSDTARELLALYQRVKFMLHASPDEAHAREVLRVEMPTSKYDDLLNQARREADAERTRLRLAAERGEWLWS